MHVNVDDLDALATNRRRQPLVGRNRSGRCDTRRVPRPASLLRPANRAQINPGETPGIERHRAVGSRERFRPYLVVTFSISERDSKQNSGGTRTISDRIEFQVATAGARIAASSLFADEEISSVLSITTSTRNSLSIGADRIRRSFMGPSLARPRAAMRAASTSGGAVTRTTTTCS